MENDLIYRQDAIDVVNKNRDSVFHDSVHYEDAVYDISNLPSAQPERKRGKWLADNRPGGGFWVCSCCKFPSEAFAANVLYKFCPHCGADMRGGQDD